MARQRLQKILSQAGEASRRQAEEMISAGRVKVDGQVVTELGAQADPLTQEIALDGRRVNPVRHQYWMVHKPVGVVSTLKDPQGRRQVSELLPPEAGRLYPVGRLDRDSEGLILMTNDGELANRLMHPRYQVSKTYRVWVEGMPDRHTLESLRAGVEIGEEEATGPARVYIKGGSPYRSKLSFVITEGKKREIRRMCEAVGHPVHRLVRVALGPIKLGSLPLGQARPLSPGEVDSLRQAAGLTTCKPRPGGVKKPGRRAKDAPGRSAKGSDQRGSASGGGKGRGRKPAGPRSKRNIGR